MQKQEILETYLKCLRFMTSLYIIYILVVVKKRVQGSEAVDRMNGKGIKNTCRGRGEV